MQNVMGFLQNQKIELNVVHEKTDAGFRREAAMYFTAAMLQNPNCPLSHQRLVSVAIECADELIKQLNEKK